MSIKSRITCLLTHFQFYYVDYRYPLKKRIKKNCVQGNFAEVFFTVIIYQQDFDHFVTMVDKRF